MYRLGKTFLLSLCILDSKWDLAKWRSGLLACPQYLYSNCWKATEMFTRLSFPIGNLKSRPKLNSSSSTVLTLLVVKLRTLSGLTCFYHTDPLISSLISPTISASLAFAYCLTLSFVTLKSTWRSLLCCG